MFEDALSSPPTLVQISIHNIIKRVLGPLTPILDSAGCGNHPAASRTSSTTTSPTTPTPTTTRSRSSLQTRCDWEIKVEVCKYYLASLPTNLSERIVEEAYKLLDNHYDVDKLLLIILSTVDNWRSTRLITPVYLYKSPDSRTRLLERLLSCDLLENLTEAHFNMYNFFHRSDLKNEWSEEGEKEYEMQRLSLVEGERLLLRECLERSTCLTNLTIHTVCSDLLITTISKSCIGLRKLDVSFSKNVTDDGMATLATSVPHQSTMEAIHLENTSVTQGGVFMLLEHLKQLRFIDTCVMANYLYCMQNFFPKPSDNPSTQSSLDTNNNSDGSLLSRTFAINTLQVCLTSHQPDRLSILSVMAALFPHLTTLKLHALHRAEHANLTVGLARLPALTSLTIGSVPIHSLIGAFSTIGANLTSLCYVCYSEQRQPIAGHAAGQAATAAATASINFSIIAELCPRLQSLSISGAALTHDELISQNALANLETCAINVHAFVPRRVWMHLLSACPLLTTIELTKCEGLTDQTLADLLLRSDSHNTSRLNEIDHQGWFAPPSCSQLERFWLKGCHRCDIQLTEASVALLCRVCPRLCEVGDCTTWSMARRDYSINDIRGIM